jgi:hypothetical protein
MNDQEREETPEVRPESLGQGCLYLIALAIFATIECVEAIPYHLRFYAWCAWHFTGGQITLHVSLWRLRQGQKRIRKSNPYYRKLTQERRTKDYGPGTNACIPQTDR